MRMIRFLIPCLMCCALSLLRAQPGFPSYRDRSELALAPAGALKFGLYGYDNPAIMTYVREPDASFVWSDEPGRWNDFNRWGLFLGVPNLGFSVNKEKAGGPGVTDCQLSAAAGDRGSSVGIAYGWSAGARTSFQRSNIFKLGTLLRPNPYISCGLTGTAASDGSAQEGVFDLAGRPLGSEVLTLFADYAIRNSQRLNDGAWSLGGVVEALPGIRVTGRFLDTRAFSLGLELSLGRVGVSTQTHRDAGGRRSGTTYGIRMGAADRTVLKEFSRGKDYVGLDLNGPVKYQRYVFFDHSHTLSGILAEIGAAQEDERVGGIAISTSGMSIPREMLWEIREKLKEFKAAGKRVVVFVDRPDINVYHFASVADKIVLDPQGFIFLPGFVVGRTYFKGSLAKLGIGFDELRFFKYKSADEVFSRDSMSSADKEQWQAVTDELYRLAASDICEGRHWTRATFDSIVNSGVLFLPDEALASGLVDTIGRWEDAEAIVARIEGRPRQFMGPESLDAFTQPYDRVWGEPPRIAVIYALGICAMDEGIAARSLVKDVEAAGNDRRVQALVLRVDSPGGDGMASDYIAEAIAKVRKKKPVIVSQGHVAASGGYWLSMNADTIVASPGTITGSIGVIGGWVYNTGLKQYLGMSTDLVKSGEHADLGFGFTVPLLGASLPDRDLTAAERGKAGQAILALYRLFVRKVAAGRRMTPEAIEPLAQGRVWTGTAGKSLGLVDVIGGLDDAIRIARTVAGIPPGQEVTVEEYPGRPLIDPRMFIPKLLGADAPPARSSAIDQILFRLDHNGQPLPMLPLDYQEMTGGEANE